MNHLSQSEADPSRLTVLLVDDEEALRWSMKACLEDLDYQVLQAANGLEGLSAFADHPADIVLTDLRMPVMNGLEFIAALRQKSPETPIVVVSATGNIQDAIEAIRDGAWDYITKPILESGELDLVIRRNVERARLLIENRRYREHLEALVNQQTQRLQESEELYRTIVEQFSEALFLIDERGEVAEWNRASEAITGLPRETVLHQPIWEVQSKLAHPQKRTPEHLAARKKMAMETLQSGSSPYFFRAIESEIHRPDGQIRITEQTHFPIRTRRGFRLASVSSDITARKKTEDTFQTILRGTSRTFGEGFFRQLTAELSRACGARYAWIGELPTPDSQALQILACWAGEAFQENFSYPVTDGPLSAFRGEEICHISSGMQKQFPEDRQMREWKVESFLGIHLYNTAGERIGALAVCDDKPLEEIRLSRDLLTIFSARAGAEIERRQSEKYRSESERRLLELLEHTRLLALMIDLQGNILFCNHSLLQILGVPDEDMRGESFFQELLPESFRREFRESFLLQLAADSLPHHFEIPLQTRSGEIRQVHWDNTILRDTAGKPCGMASLGRDLTPEIELEKQLRLSQKMEALGTLAGGIAHDFNNILGAIIGYAELTRRMFKETDEAYPYQCEILTASRRAKDLVQQILTISRQQEQVKLPTDLSLLVQEVVRLIRKVAPSTIEIRQQTEKEAGSVLADPGQLHQVLMNLCTNAIQAMQGQSRGLLEIRLDPCTLGGSDHPAPGQLPPGEYVRLQVRDTGHGMSGQILSRIFDPYFTTKKPGEGTGLGLSVARGIITNHEGALLAESEEERGSKFDIYLPRIDSAPVVEEEREEDLLTGTERVLFVDDEKQLVQTGKMMLQYLGYQVTAVHSSTEALRIFLEHPMAFDLVLTDQTMPDITGAALAEEILCLRPDMPVILCTGYSDQIDRTRSMKIGIREFLQKPLTAAMLSTALRRALDSSFPGGKEGTNGTDSDRGG